MIKPAIIKRYPIGADSLEVDQDLGFHQNGFDAIALHEHIFVISESTSSYYDIICTNSQFELYSGIKSQLWSVFIMTFPTEKDAINYARSRVSMLGGLLL